MHNGNQKKVKLNAGSVFMAFCTTREVETSIIGEESLMALEKDYKKFCISDRVTTFWFS